MATTGDILVPQLQADGTFKESILTPSAIGVDIDTLRGFEQVPTYASLPSPGRLTRLYLTADTNQFYRWTGTTYRLTPDEADAGTY